MAEPPEGLKPEHRRRPRYRGTHPRRFADKYKELAPAQYPEIAEHVRSQGHTPAGQHVAIMVGEVIAALAPGAGDRGVDATLGWGGHAEALVARLLPGGQLLGLDVDPTELPKTEARLRSLGIGDDVLIVQRTNFAGLRAAIDRAGWLDGVDFVFADLGVSSMQIDNPARGFSFKADGPLDMRMNQHRGPSAAEWLAQTSVETLTTLLTDAADEPRAKEIAAALMARCGDIHTTQALSDIVRRAVPRRPSTEEADLTVRRVFQALRIAINDELGTLDALLAQMPRCLRPGGRVALLTFHSGEDRRVKKAFDESERSGLYEEVMRDVVRASPAEQRANPRARAAKLRWARRAR